MSYKIDAKATKQAMQGRWLELLPIIDSKTKPAISATGKHVPCPLGTGDLDGFRIPLDADFDGHAFHNKLSTSELSDGFKLLMWLNGWSFYSALKAVNDVLNSGTTRVKTNTTTSQASKTDMRKKRKVFDRWLHESRMEPNIPAIRYYMNRGLVDAPKLRSGALRYHDSIPFLHDGRLVTDKITGELITTPAILCGMRSSTGVSGFSVIRITQDGLKADKLMIGAIANHHGISGALVQSKQLFSITPKMSGSCFRLGEVLDTWGVGEGVETMLAVAGALKTESVAATTTAAMLERVDIPEHVKVLNIYADKDINGRGEEAATKLMEREKEKREVNIIIPERTIPEGEKGIDWLDCASDLGSLFGT